MAKKGTRPAKMNQQRAREEQWKRRLAIQSQGEAGTVVADEPAFDDGVSETMPHLSKAEIAAVSITATPRTSPATRSTPGSRAATPGTAPSAATVAAAQRRATTAARTARTRAAANAMTVDDEMHYVRTDIRRLVLLTVACLLVLIVLFFVIPR